MVGLSCLSVCAHGLVQSLAHVGSNGKISDEWMNNEYLNEWMLNYVHGSCQVPIRNCFILKFPLFPWAPFHTKGAYIATITSSRAETFQYCWKVCVSLGADCCEENGPCWMYKSCFVHISSCQLYQVDLNAFHMGFPSVTPMQGFPWTLAIPLLLLSGNLCRSPAFPSAPQSQEGTRL